MPGRFHRFRGFYATTAKVMYAVIGIAVVAALIGMTRAPNYHEILQHARGRAAAVLTDRHGAVLRLEPDALGSFSLWRGIEHFPECLLSAVIRAEDKRFHSHPGFDPFAVIRALKDNIPAGRAVSGASTITQQVVRLITPRPRTLKSKIIELVFAVKMEAQLTKREILELYLNLAPMGGNIKGAPLASRIYFDRDISRISYAQAAALAVIPRSPTRLDPKTTKGRTRVCAAAARLLAKMKRAGDIDGDVSVKVDPHLFRITSSPLKAPHFTDFVRMRDGAGSGKSSLDLRVQSLVETTLAAHGSRLSKLGITQAGAIAVGFPNCEILAMMGSFSYSNHASGYVNAVTATRSAGSTLKPFLYALALENGFDAFSQVPDTFRAYQTPHGDYLPYNADRRWYGPVTIRSALGGSLNIPAVKTLRTLGIEPFYDLLSASGVMGALQKAPAAHYGLGLAIGNMEVSLHDLAQAYTAFARGGVMGALRRTPGRPDETRLFSPETAYIVTHVLSDSTARLLTFGNPEFFDFGFPVALKTGTSSHYRDCWMIAYTSERLVGLWAGNFDGKAISRIASATALGPVMRDIMVSIHGARAPRPFPRPHGVRDVGVCWFSGKKAGPKCGHVVKELAGGDREIPECELAHNDDTYPLSGGYAQWFHDRSGEQGRGRFALGTDAAAPTLGSGSRRSAPVEILTPHNHDRPARSADSRGILLRASAEPLVPYLTWFVDGIEIGRTEPPYELRWEPTRGEHTIMAVTPRNRAAVVSVFVE